MSDEQKKPEPQEEGKPQQAEADQGGVIVPDRAPTQPQTAEAPGDGVIVPDKSGNPPPTQP
jgi:hypothetical protein